MTERAAPQSFYEVLIVGAGISGIGAGIELLERGISSFLLVESASDLGGTWRDNTYPGVAVDIPSVSYCFSFETDFPWSNSYAPGHELQAYVQRCADKYGVAPHIRYNSRVAGARWNRETDSWTTALDDGTEIASRYLIAATGPFGTPKLPEIPGLDEFAGRTMHSARWDHAHDLVGKRVAVIGTGASAVQIVPAIASQVSQLSVFQRTPIWVAPRPDSSVAPTSRRWFRQRAAARRALRALSELQLELLTFLVVNYRITRPVLRLLERITLGWMRRQTGSAELADLRLPTYGLGCKRPATSNTYLATFNRANLALVTRTISRVEPRGIVTDDGVLHEVDTIVLATGFLTTEKGNAPSFDVVGESDVELGEWWDRHGRQAYAGVSVPGFPNFFLASGPYAGGLNWFTMLEASLAHIMTCIEEARTRGATRVAISGNAHERYMQHIWQRAERAVFKSAACAGANSYYIDRHGHASLPLPHTPWWRARWIRRAGTRGYQFGGTS